MVEVNANQLSCIKQVTDAFGLHENNERFKYIVNMEFAKKKDKEINVVLVKNGIIDNFVSTLIGTVIDINYIKLHVNNAELYASRLAADANL